jgi:dihydroorotase
VVAMPNTNPAIDCAAVVREVLDLGAGAMCDVRPAGAITKGRRGEELAPLGEMASLGVRLFTDDGRGVQDARLMRRALEYASALGVTLAQHCEDERLAAGGHMHEGEWSSRLGIPGAPAAAEELMVARDIALLRLTNDQAFRATQASPGSRMHFQHLSTAGSVAAVRAAKVEGLAVTAEVTPHHLSLTDAVVASYDTVFKVNPPLRPSADVEAVRAGLEDGAIDAIATDHAPHAQEDKERPFDLAPPGMLGLETALAVALTHLDLPVEQVLALLSWRPARIAGLDLRGHGGPIAEGADANLCVIDPAAVWLVEPERLASRSRNTPFAGRKLTGRARHTLLRGEPVVLDGEAQR